MKRKSRLFALAEYLRGRRTGVTAEQLAARFEVSLRTIYRDLDALREAALPLNSDRGPGGGYALDRSYSLPPVNFTAREAALLVTLGRYAREMRLLPFAETLDAALDKVRGALSASAQRELGAHMEKLVFVGVPALPVEPAVRAAVERAWFEQSPLRIELLGSAHEVQRHLVRIEGVLLERSSTYLQCTALEGGAPLRFRLDRVLRAEAVPNTPQP